MIVVVSVARRRTLRTAVAACLVAAACASCSPSKAARTTASATVPTEPATTTTTNPYAVPAVIDAAYVNRVLAGLDAAVGDVTRLVVRTHTIPPEAYDRLKALYVDPVFLQIQIDGFQSDMRGNFADYKPIPGNKHTLVSHTITTKATCIFAEVRRDFSAVAADNSDSLHTLWVGLSLLDQARDPKHYNPTPWAYIYDGFTPSHSQPSDPCLN